MMSVTILDNKPSSTNTAFEFFIAFSLSLIYFYGMMLLARTTVLFEVCVCLIIPGMIFYLNQHSARATPNRVKQLIIIESLYMFFVIISKLSIYGGLVSLNTITSYGFFSLFIIQFLFFIIYQYQVKSYFGLVRTLLFIILIWQWFNQIHLDSAVDSQGRFLMWGSEAPTAIILYYCFWVIGVPLVDSRTLPNFINALFHFASVSVALWSREFFHVRLLTASHLFILDSLFHFSDKNKLFCALSERQFEFYQQHIRKKIDCLTLLGCIIIFVIYTYG